MTKELFASRLIITDQAERTAALITQKRIRHLPVMEEGQVVGVLSIGDVLNKLISDQKFIIRELEKYIHGDYGSDTVLGVKRSSCCCDIGENLCKLPIRNISASKIPIIS